jgi:hypothetical protein
MKCPTIVAFCLLMLGVTIATYDNTRRRELRNCIFQQLQIDNENAVERLKLDDNQVVKLQTLINNEINRGTMDDISDERQQQVIQHIKTVAVNTLPNVPTDQLNEVLFKLKGTAGYCLNQFNLPGNQ